MRVVLFQSLTGRLKTLEGATKLIPREKFQSLTGRLKTRDASPSSPERLMFQSLTGRLKTRLSNRRQRFEFRFNPSQVG